MLYLRGLMEKLGRGSVMICKACKAYELPMPFWRDDAQGVTLTYLAPEVTPEVLKLIAAFDGAMARSALQEKLGLKDAENFCDDIARQTQ